MSNAEVEFSLKLDPWSASSLLQKAIRRSEIELARHAARTLHRYRGKGMWRRLMTIAFEDIGIADPQLVLETVFLATDQQARALLGYDLELILDLSERLALAPKDRSADYLICATLKLASGQRELSSIAKLPASDLVSLVSCSDQPLVRRSAAALRLCGLDADQTRLVSGLALDDLLAAFAGKCDERVLQAIETAATAKADRFILMTPILASELAKQKGQAFASPSPVPSVQTLDEIPLYTFDKHTWAGKRAISEFAQTNRQLRELLTEHLPQTQATSVALMAAFYADAIPIANRLNWEQSSSLERLGLEADMTGAGCPEAGIAPILECTRKNLPHLNELRRSVLLGRRRT